MHYQLAIFDMDGTVLDTLEDLKNALNVVLEDAGFPERSLEEVRHFVGNGIRKLIERGVPAGTDPAVTERVFDAFNRYYALHCAEQTRPYDGITELIVALRKAGLKTALLSNKSDYAVQSLCQQYFDGLFDIALGVKEGLQKKPSPDGVERICRQLKVGKPETVYIGDSEVDVATAANAGIDCIAVEWGFRTREEILAANAQTIVSTNEELFSAILNEERQPF